MMATARTRPEPGAALGVFRRSLELELARELAGTGVLEEAARPMVLSRQSKRARPMIAFLVGRALRAAPARVLDVAVAVELVHAASLLHDDVVDGAAIRRGLPSANARFGSSLAVLSGDLLLTAALGRLRAHGSDAIERAVSVVAEMTRAVAFEVAMRRRTDIALADWRTMAEGKTGALFGCAAWLVASAAGDLARAERFDRALRHLGVAFQIADDVDDLVAPPLGAAGDTADASEPAYQDLRDGNPSFPVLVAAHASVATRAALEATWASGSSADDVASLAAHIIASGAVGAAVRAVHDEIAKARALLAPELTSTPPVPELATILTWAETLATSTEARYPRAPDAETAGATP